jgi:hypothetical protein
VSAEIAVRARLVATSAVTALVSTRIYTLKLPDTVTYPAIRVQLIDEPQRKHLRGPDGLTRARVQVDVYEREAATNAYGSLLGIADAVSNALVFEPFTQGTVAVQSAERIDRRTLREADELNLLRVMQDFYVWSSR